MVAPRNLLLNEEATISVSETRTKQKDHPTRRKRIVTFDDCLDIHLIPGRQQFSREEIQDYFWSKNDHCRIRGEVREILKLMMNGGFQEGRPIFLGLESYEPKAFYERSQRMRLAKSAVLRQRTSQTIGHEWFSQTYQELAKSSADLAHTRALMDRQTSLGTAPFHQVIIR